MGHWGNTRASFTGVALGICQSLTLYNDHHSFSPNTIKRYSLCTKKPGIETRY